MAASDVENAHNERPKINTCWCIQIKEPYPFGYLLVMAIYPSCRNKLTLVKNKHFQLLISLFFQLRENLYIHEPVRSLRIIINPYHEN